MISNLTDRLMQSNHYPRAGQQMLFSYCANRKSKYRTRPTDISEIPFSDYIVLEFLRWSLSAVNVSSISSFPATESQSVCCELNIGRRTKTLVSQMPKDHNHELAKYNFQQLTGSLNQSVLYISSTNFWFAACHIFCSFLAT